MENYDQMASIYMRIKPEITLHALIPGAMMMLGDMLDQAESTFIPSTNPA